MAQLPAGRVARQFATLQQKHFTDKDSKQTGRRWTTEIIKKLTKVAWDMWDHRNDILHNDGANFHKKMEVSEADVMIRAEFNTGKTNLLTADKFLLRSFCTKMKLDLQEKKKWLQDVAGARAAWVAKQNEPPSFNVECQCMHEWRTGTHRTGTTAQTAGPSAAGGALQNQTASEAGNSIALHPNTAHRGQIRTTQKVEPGSTQTQTDQRSSSQAGAQIEAPKRKRAQNPQNNNRNNKKARKGTQINRNKKPWSSGRSILCRVLKNPKHHTQEIHD